MAKFVLELPTQILNDFAYIHSNANKIFEEMVSAGADVVVNNITKNIGGAFNEGASQRLLKYLKKTKVYHPYNHTVTSCKVAFYGYYKREGEEDSTYTNRRKQKQTEAFEYHPAIRHLATRTGGRQEASYEYEQEGVPVPLIVMAREFGTSRGEQKKPFVRKSWSNTQIRRAMLKAQKEASRGLLENE